jgi:hypothetical protein
VAALDGRAAADDKSEAGDANQGRTQSLGVHKSHVLNLPSGSVPMPGERVSRRGW